SLVIREIGEGLEHHDLELQDRIVGLATSVALALLGLRHGHALDVSAEVLPPHDLLDRFQRIAFGADRLKPALNIEKARLPHDSLARSAHGPLRSASQIRSDLARRIFRGALKTVLAGGAPDALLDSYEAERIAFARRLVKTTDQVFTLATAEGKTADVIRTRLAPTILPVLVKFGVFREFMFRTVSQIRINYRHRALSEERAGAVHGGDRLKWVIAGDVDNYEPLKAMTWQVHVYGAASPELKTWCQEHGLPLHVFAWRPQHGEAGFAQDALYLIRPDTYVALAQRSGAVDSLRRYFEQRGIRAQTHGGTQKHAA